MSTMHQFYQRLTHSPAIHDPYQQGLVQLMRADRQTVSALGSELEWVNWSAANPENPTA